MKKILEFELKNSKLVYMQDAKDGCETATLFLLPPSFMNIKYTSKLEQLLGKSMIQAIENLKNTVKEEDREKVKEEEEFKVDETTIKTFINFSEIDFMDFFDCFVDFLINKNCFLDEERKVCITKKMLNDIDIEDLKNMLYSYLANFMKPLMS